MPRNRANDGPRIPIAALLPRRGGGPRGRIVELLRRSPLTANQIAEKLGVTHNAVRAHLGALARAGFVRKHGFQKGSTRPAVLYELAPLAESLLSRAYIPFVAHLLQALEQGMSRRKLDSLMRNVGRSLAAEWPRLRGPLEERVKAATVLLEELGAVTKIETVDHRFTIRGYGCLLAEAVHGRPEVCRAMESLLTELLRVPVKECCERGERPRCCFHVGSVTPAVSS